MVDPLLEEGPSGGKVRCCGWHGILGYSSHEKGRIEGKVKKGG